MTDYRENAPTSRPIPQDSKQTLAAMRGGWGGWVHWTAEDQAKIDERECTDASCMSVTVNVGFQGLDEGSPLSQAAAVGDDLRAAWQAKLSGEGKRSGGTSLRDLMLGNREPGQPG